MFSRAPSAALRTGIFFAGRDAVLALDMMETAKKALLKPFEVSLFADPYGSFTTAGAMVACVEKLLREKKQRELKGARIVIYGATGVVGYSAGVIAALEGADVTMVGYSGLARVQKLTEEIEQRFGVKVKAADGSTPEQVRALLIDHEIALCAARAGVQVLSKDDLAAAKNLLIAADVNAVPPLGVEGCGLHDNGVVISLEDKVTFGGTSHLKLIFDPKTFKLRQWQITDPQGYETLLSLFNIDQKRTPDPALFKIDVNAKSE